MQKCRYCQNEIEIFLDLSDIPVSVTSDSQIIDIGIKVYKCSSCGLIQKIATEDIQNHYFNQFHSQSLVDGDEQIKFVNGIAYPRSELIINNIKFDIKEKGTLLDIGTGSGVFLKSFQKKYPQWELSAQDIQLNSAEQLFKIIKKDNFYLGDISNIKNQYDFVSIIGVLGHIPNLLKFLNDLKNLIDNNGKMVMFTPNIQKNLFSVVIIDNITHFNKSILYKILSHYFKKVDFFEFVQNEITIGINFEQNGESFHEVEENFDIQQQAVMLEKFVRYIHHSQETFIVLGSATVSTYLAAILKERLLYFVDEDITKHHKKHLNKDIKKFEDIDKRYKIILPFLDDLTIQKIKERYKSYSFLSYQETL